MEFKNEYDEFFYTVILYSAYLFISHAVFLLVYIYTLLLSALVNICI